MTAPLADSNEVRFIRRMKWTVAALGLLLPGALWGAREGLLGMTNHPLQWLSNGATSGTEFQWFSDLFEHYDPLVIGWAGSLPDDPRILAMVDGLKEHAKGDAPLFVGVTSSREVWESLTRGPLELSPEAAFDRLYPAMIGEQGETLVIALLSDQATARTREAIEVIYDVASNRCGLTEDEVHLGGPTVESVAIDDASIESLVRNVIPSGIAVLLVAAPCLRSIWLTIVMGALAGVCEAMALAAVYYFGSPFTGLLVVMPALLFVVFISGTVHFCNYFYDALEEGPSVPAANAATEALRMGKFPCSLAAATTAVGIFSLATSRIEPVQVFAVYAGCGVLLALLVMLLTVPGILAVRARQLTRLPQASSQNSSDVRRSSLIVQITTKAPWSVASVVAAGSLICGWGLGGLNPTMDQSDFFAEESKMMSDMRWLEQHIGPLLPLEIAVRLDTNHPMSFGERMHWIQKAAMELAELESIGGCLTAATFAPEISSGTGMAAIIRRRVELREISNQREAFVSTPYVALDGAQEVWRISVRVAAGFDHDQVREDVGNVMTRMMQSLPAGLAFTAPHLNAGPESGVAYTGLFMLIADSRRRLLADLASSFSVALLVIAVALSATFRSVMLGLASIVPNIFPSLLVFGCMGWLRADMDVGAMITASIGLGIAVDDTVHYLAWFTEGLDRGHSPEEAAAYAYRRCAGAMLRTTLICSAGLIVFLFSPLVLAARFAAMICVLLAAALIGDLVFLPAILCGPLRFWCLRRAAGARSN